MNFDSEFAKKKLFWILVGVAIPLELLVVLLGSLAVSGSVSAQKKKIDDELKKARPGGEILGKAHIEKAKKEFSFFAKGETLVHKKAWGSQKVLMKWPEKFQRMRAFTDGIFAVEVTVLKEKPKVQETPKSVPEGSQPQSGAGSTPPLQANPKTGIPQLGQTPPNVPASGEQTTTPPADSATSSEKKENTEGGYQELVGQLVEVKDMFRGMAPVRVLDDKGEFKKDANGRPVFVIVRPTVDMIIKDKEGAVYKKDKSFGLSKIFRKGDYLKVKYIKGKYFGDKITKPEYNDYIRSYPDQIAKLLKIVDPLRPDGTGVVQFKVPYGPQQAGGQGGGGALGEQGGYPGAPGTGPTTSPKGGPWRYDPSTGEGEIPDKAYPWLNWVPKWPKWDFDDQGTKRNELAFKEVWTAQEDIWIQSELFQLVRKANGYVSNFRVHPDAKNQKARATFSNTQEASTSQIYYFQNPYWTMQMQLVRSRDGTLEENILKVRAFNRLTRRQSTDVKFKITVVEPATRGEGQTPPLVIHLPKNGLEEGKAVPLSGLQGSTDESRAFGTPWLEFRINDITPTGIYNVEQVLTWQTAAVKRIDHIVIGNGQNPGLGTFGSPETQGGAPGAGSPGFGRGGVPGGLGATASTGPTGQSHRTVVAELKPFPAFKSEEEPEELSDPNFPGAMPGGPGMPQGEGAGPGGVPTAPKGTGSPFEFKRYIEVGGRTRKLPVGISLIIDQRHVGLVLAAFSNSKLRMLTTQVLLNRYPDSVRPGTPEDAQGDPDANEAGNPGAPGGLGGGFGPGGFSPGRGFGGPGEGASGGYPGGYPGQTGPLASKKVETASETPESNMELVVYGIVSLYQRYPAKPDPLPGAGEPGEDGVPAVPASGS